MGKYLFFMVALSLFVVFYMQGKTELAEKARWEYESDDGIVHRIVKVDDYWVETIFNADNGDFIQTYGGKWSMQNDTLKLDIHFDSSDSSRVGSTTAYAIGVSSNAIDFDNKSYTKIDSDKEGVLTGAWFINGRMRDGTLQPRTFSSRRTLKILTESSFQWVAYHVETGAFSGTGGGTYDTSEDGKYTENIEFFSRDNSRVGASLVFDYELIDGVWHHKGNSSRGTPIYETWARFPEQW